MLDPGMPPREAGWKRWRMGDLVVIGAGPAGVTAACRAAELGARTILVTQGAFGGMAAHGGPVPVRALAHHGRGGRCRGPQPARARPACTRSAVALGAEDARCAAGRAASGAGRCASPGDPWVGRWIDAGRRGAGSGRGGVHDPRADGYSAPFPG